MKNIFYALYSLILALFSTTANASPAFAWIDMGEEETMMRVLFEFDEDEVDAPKEDVALVNAVVFEQIGGEPADEFEFGKIYFVIDKIEPGPNVEVVFEVDGDAFEFVMDDEGYLDGNALSVREIASYCELVDAIREGANLRVISPGGKTTRFPLTGSKRNLLGFAPSCG